MVRRSDNPLIELGASFHDAYREVQASYRIGEVGRFTPRPKGIQATGSNADWHWQGNKYYLAIERARDWQRNNLVVGAGIERVTDNVMGEEGPIVNPTTRDKDFNAAAKEKFDHWADSPEECDITGEDDFWEMSRLAFSSCLTDGDHLGVPLLEGQLQTFEAHRLKTPSSTKKNVVLGVELNNVNRPLKYWVTRDDVGVLNTIKLVGDMVQLPARDENGFKNVFHPRMRRRSSQTRGVTPLAPATDMIGIHDDLQFATLVKAQIAACFAIIREMDTADKKPVVPPRGAAGDTQLGEREVQNRFDGSTEKLESIGPGMDIRSRDGEKIKGFAPGIPNPEFFPHATMVLTFISINLGLPLAVLLLDPTKTNFSGWRGAVDQARQGFRRLQKWFAAKWFTPIYEWKLRQFAADDATFRRFMEELGADAFKHEWQSPGWDYIQPVQDGQADHYQVSHLLTSPRRAAAKRNLVKAQIDKETAEDNANSLGVFMDMAQKFNDERKLTGTDKEVPWQYFMRLPLPDNVSMTTDPAGEDGAAKQSQETAA